MSKKRNSTYELIKVIAVFCIVICHSIPVERVECHYATEDPFLFGIIIFRQLGSVGNAIFLISSTWFLVDDNRMDIKKVRQIIADNQAISLIILFLFVVCGGGSLITWKVVIKHIFPFLFNVLWYVTCYVLYYCIHGLVNRALNCSAIDRERTIFLIIALDVVVFGIGFPYFNDLIGFILIHIFTWYIKKESRLLQYGRWLLVSGITGWLAGAVVFNLLGVEYSFLGSYFQNWNRFYNPFILMLAYGSVIISSQREIYIDKVNVISRLSLYIVSVNSSAPIDRRII